MAKLTCEVVFPGGHLPMGMTVSQIDDLLDACKESTQGCFIDALLVFLKTGNLYAAAIEFLECMLAPDEDTSALDCQRVECTIALIRKLEVHADQQYLSCVFDLLMGLIKGSPFETLLFEFIMCLLGSVQPPPDDGELEDPEYRECKRCG